MENLYGRYEGKMKRLKKFQIVLLLFFIGISILSGCSSLTEDESTGGGEPVGTDTEAAAENYTGTQLSEEEQASEEIQTSQETEWFSSSEEIMGLGLPEDMLAYWLVLNSRQSFVSTDEGYQEFYWDEYYWRLGSPAEQHQATRFMVVDMNGDGANEIVLECLPESVMLLHYEDGTVYSYQFVYRGMKRIHNNGIYEGSNGAASTYYFRITALDKDGYTQETLASVDDGCYEVEGAEATYEQFCDYVLQNIESAELAETLDFTEDRLDKCLLGDLSEEELSIVKHAPRQEMKAGETYDLSREEISAYFSVMSGEKSFISVTDDNQEYYLNKYHLKKGKQDEDFRFQYYSIVDMDQDGKYELVLTGGLDITQIMHYEEGQVYSYQFDYYDEIGAIAKDGVFVTGPPSNSGYGKIAFFEKDGCIIEPVDNHGSINDDRIRYNFFSEEAIKQLQKQRSELR